MRAVGMILAGGNSYRMKELSNKRAIAAMPIAGSFRSIDFALSSMSNSGIQKVAVLTQYNSRSLNQHLSSSKWWDFGRKQGGLFVFPPMVTSDNDFWYRGTADAIHQNLDFLKQCHEPYVVIASGDCIYKLDYAKVLEYAQAVAGRGQDDLCAVVIQDIGTAGDQADVDGAGFETFADRLIGGADGDLNFADVIAFLGQLVLEQLLERLGRGDDLLRLAGGNKGDLQRFDGLRSRFRSLFGLGGGGVCFSGSIRGFCGLGSEIGRAHV